MAFGNILRVRPKKRDLCLLRCGCSSKGKEGVSGLFVFLEDGVQLMNEIRGKLGESQGGGFEANIELDIGIRSIFNMFLRAHAKVIRRSPLATRMRWHTLEHIHS